MVIIVLWGQVLQYHFSSSPSIFLIKMDTSYFFYGLASILRGLSLGHLSIVIPKTSIIRLRNSPDPIGFPLKVTELLTWHTFPIYLI